MKLIVGLGNPGDNFSSTKHNFGFWVIDKLVEERSLKYKFGKGEYIFAKNQKHIFIKPTTFSLFCLKIPIIIVAKNITETLLMIFSKG